MMVLLHDTSLVETDRSFKKSETSTRPQSEIYRVLRSEQAMTNFLGTRVSATANIGGGGDMNTGQLLYTCAKGVQSKGALLTALVF